LYENHYRFLAALLLCASTASATLIDQGDIVYDDTNGKYWIQDTTQFVGLTFSEQRETISALTTGGMSWRMAGESDINILTDTYLLSDLTKAFAPATYPDRKYWKGRVDSHVGVGVHYEFLLYDLSGGIYGSGFVGVHDSEVFPGAFAIAYIPASAQTPTPILPSVWMLGSGLAGIGCFRRRMKPRQAFSV